jgi:hypothetical protein
MAEGYVGETIELGYCPGSGCSSKGVGENDRGIGIPARKLRDKISQL